MLRMYMRIWDPTIDALFLPNGTDSSKWDVFICFFVNNYFCEVKILSDLKNKQANTLLWLIRETT